MLVMDMSAAAAAASSSTAGSTSVRAPARIASRKCRFRNAIAEATATPQRWAPEREPDRSTASRLSAMSLAAAGIQAVRFASAFMAMHRRASAALCPVARAKLFRLKSVEHPQYLVDVPAHRKIIHAYKPDGPVRVDNECRAERHTLLPVEHTEGARQLALGVREHREG